MLIAATILNVNEINNQQYAAKGKIKINTLLEDGKLKLNLEIADGWHINASNVLQKHLIPTSLASKSDRCSELSDIKYPQGKRVSLGFQDGELLVYETQAQISAEVQQSDNVSCDFLAAELLIQACTDEVCHSPETLQIRGTLN